MTGIYNERKTKRALKHVIVLKAKIAWIKKKSGIERLESLIATIEKNRVAIPCPTCHKVHDISISDYKAGEYRRQCRTCFDQETDRRDNEAFEKAVQALGKDFIAGSIETDAPRHCLHLCMPMRKYLDKSGEK